MRSDEHLPILLIWVLRSAICTILGIKSTTNTDNRDVAIVFVSNILCKGRPYLPKLCTVFIVPMTLLFRRPFPEALVDRDNSI